MSVAQMIVRVDRNLKSKVDRLAKAEGKSTSDVVRELLAGYVQDRDIGAYIDDLWARTGAELRANGKGPRDVRRAIREVRGRK